MLIAFYIHYDAKVIFSREIKGKNIKEYEYGIHGDDQALIYYRWGNMPHTFKNVKAPKQRLNGRVYIELENGNIAEISGLYKLHMDIYNEGDLLLKPAGVRFAIVLNRECDSQPCPICGEINDMSRDCCKSCNLKIER